MTDDQNQSVEPSGATTETAKPQDPDPILQEFPEIKEAEKKQEEQRQKEQQNQSGQ